VRLIPLTIAACGLIALVPGAVNAAIGSTFVLTAPVTAVAGSTPSVTGALLLADEAPAQGLDVAVEMLRPDNVVVPLGTVQPDAFGAFTIPVPGPLTLEGTYRFTATFAGNATHDPATSNVDVQVQRTNTTLLFTASRTAVAYRQPVTLTATLTGGAPHGTPVSIYRTVGTTRKRIAAAGVNASGKLVVRIRPERNARYSASFGGIVSHEPSTSVSRTVQVYPIIRAAFPNRAGRSGATSLYRFSTKCISAGRGCPTFKAAVTPNHGGKYVYAFIEQRTSRGWKVVAGYRKRLGRSSTASLVLRYGTKAAVGKSYRVFAEFRGDSDHRGVAWGNWYFKVTSGSTAPVAAPSLARAIAVHGAAAGAPRPLAAVPATAGASGLYR
jgi:hypothetical protein